MSPPEDIARLSTGSASLDEILSGGFPTHSLNILMGHPGTGKTILAEQMLFENARGERPVLYITTLSEPIAKVITYLQRFDFFDPALMGQSVIYESVGPELLEKGVDHLVHRIKALIQEVGPQMIVVDSFKALHDLEESPTKIRRVLADLAGMLAAYDTTTFLVGEYGEEQIPRHAEFAVADGIVHLMRVTTGKQDQRFLRVLKLRGTSYQEGLHAFHITDAGLEIYPRLVTPDIPEDYTPVLERVKTGVEGLDRLLGGGLWRGSTTLVSGPEGSGKTTLGLGFCLQGVSEGEPSLFMNFQEDPPQLGRTIASLGVDLAGARAGGLHLMYASPVELHIDSLVGDIFRLVEEKGVSRLVIDATGDLALAANDLERFHDYLYSLIHHLSSRRVTAMLTLEESAASLERTRAARARFASMTDAIIQLGIELDGEARRTIRVAKARGIAHDLNRHVMAIHEGGIRLLDGPDSP